VESELDSETEKIPLKLLGRNVEFVWVGISSYRQSLKIYTDS
jgi:hypothetical protein